MSKSQSRMFSRLQYFSHIVNDRKVKGKQNKGIEPLKIYQQKCKKGMKKNP